MEITATGAASNALKMMRLARLAAGFKASATRMAIKEPTNQTFALIPKIN
jgi:hypothetical protein